MVAASASRVRRYGTKHSRETTIQYGRLWMRTYSAQVCSVFTMELIKAEFMVVLRKKRKKKKISLHPNTKREKSTIPSIPIKSSEKLSSHSYTG